MNGKNERVHLVLTRRKVLHEFNGPRYELLLKAKDFSPVAIKVVDPLQISESVYVFDSFESLPDDDAVFNRPAILAWPPGSNKKL